MYNEPSSKKIVGWVIAGIVGLTLLVLALMSTITIGNGKIAVMTQFGRVTGEELGSGFHLKNPFDQANEYDVKVQKTEADATAASKDLQDANAKLVVNYRLEPGKVSDIHRTVGVDYKEKLVDPAIQEVFKASTAKFDATQLITDRNTVKGEAFKALSERLDDYGILVTDLSITNFAFSTDFSNAIEQKQVAVQNAERAKYNLEQAQIDAQAQQVQSTTLSDAYLRKLALDNQRTALEKWDGKMPNTVAGGSSGTVFNIPLQ